MKTLLLLIIAFSAFMDIQAQYNTMLGKGASYWEYLLIEPESFWFQQQRPEGSFMFVTYGEKTINGKNYTPLYICFETMGARSLQNSTIDKPKFFPIYDQLMVFAIREEGGRIYVDKDDYMEYLNGNRVLQPKPVSSTILYPVTDEGEVVLYDFNMQVGDKFPVIEGRETVFVEGIETITCKDDTERKLFHLSNGCDIIEGIGAVNGAGFLVGYLGENRKWFSIQHLCVFSKNIDMGLSREEGLANANLIYSCSYEEALEQSKEKIDHYTNVKSIYGNGSKNRACIFNLQGRRLTTQPQRGVYIRDGRKYVVK